MRTESLQGPPTRADPPPLAPPEHSHSVHLLMSVSLLQTGSPIKPDSVYLLSWHLQRCGPHGLWKLPHTSLGQAPRQPLNPHVTFNPHHHSRQWRLSLPCTDEDSEAQGGSDFPEDTQLTWNMLGPV